jgi:TonB-linked SusC/RagA family outer membrane protein
MKKVVVSTFSESGKRKEILLKMKLTLILLLAGLLQISAISYSQSAKLSLDVNGMQLAEVLREIEDISDFRFFYQREQVDVERSVNLKVENQNIDEVLDLLFPGDEIEYKIYADKLVLLAPNEILTEVQDALESLPGAFQPITVTGTVLDESGLPVTGATVAIKSSGRGTITGADGSFTIEVSSPDAILVISYVGMKSQEVSLAGRTNVNVVLDYDVIALNEVVAIGYGTMIKRDISTAIGSVDSEKLNERPSTLSLGQRIAGQVAGVNVMTNSGKPGGSPAIKIRGTGSINAGNSPLYVVDGVVGVDPATINPNIIETVDILKDAAASAIYGSQGANGVILITTKKGKAGPSQIILDNSISFGKLARYVDMLNAEELMGVFDAAYAYGGRTPPHLDPWVFFTRKEDLFNEDGSPIYNTNWQDEVTRLAISNDHSLSFSGGSETVNALASVTYKHNEGIILNSYEDQVNVFLNLNWQVKKWFDLQTTLNIGSTEQNDVDGNAFGQNPIRMMLEMHPFYPVKYPDGVYSRKGDYPAAEAGENPVRVLEELKNIFGRRFAVANTIGTFHITDHFDFTASGSYRTTAQFRNYYAGRTLRDYGEAQEGVATKENWVSGAWTAEPYFTYQNQFGRHGLRGVAGASWYYAKSDYTSAGSEGYYDDFFEYNRLQVGTTYQQPSSGMDEYQMNSYYARLNYDFDERYLLGASFRADGSSRFGANNKYGYFPSFSAAWRISSEGFFDNIRNTLNNLKLRASYGSVGNAAIGNYVTFSQLGNQQVIFNKQQEPAVVLSNLGNQDLKWEKSWQADIGLDIGLFNNRVEIITDVYNKITDDLLYYKEVPATTGYTGSWDNLGSIRNRGFEFTLNTRNISRLNFSWNTAFNFSLNRSMVLDINGDVLYGFGTRIIEGHPLNEFYLPHRLGTWGTDEAEEAAIYNKKPGDLKYEDLDNNGVIDDFDRIVAGNAMPKWEANLMNTISFKGFNFLLDLQAMYGHKLINFGRALTENRQIYANNRSSVLEAWTPENQETMVAAVRTPKDPKWGENITDTRLLEDGSFLRVRNIGLSYSLDPDLLRKIHLSTLDLGVNVENAFLFTKYTGFDPEATNFDPYRYQGVDFFQYPKPRTFSITLKLSF